MSGINGVGNNQPVQRTINQSVLKNVQAGATGNLSRSDRLELSGVGHLVKTLQASGDVRTDKVADIKAQLEAGTYEDDQKLDAAIDKLLDDLNA